MGCTPCRERMEVIAVAVGYKRFGDVWVGPDGDVIPVDEMEHHYTRLAIMRKEFRAKAARSAARALLQKLHPTKDGR